MRDCVKACNYIADDRPYRCALGDQLAAVCSSDAFLSKSRRGVQSRCCARSKSRRGVLSLWGNTRELAAWNVFLDALLRRKRFGSAARSFLCGLRRMVEVQSFQDPDAVRLELGLLAFDLALPSSRWSFDVAVGVRIGG